MLAPANHMILNYVMFWKRRARFIAIALTSSTPKTFPEQPVSKDIGNQRSHPQRFFAIAKISFGEVFPYIELYSPELVYSTEEVAYHLYVWKRAV